MYRKITVIQDGGNLEATLQSDNFCYEVGSICMTLDSCLIEDFLIKAAEAILRLNKDRILIKCEHYNVGDKVLLKKDIENVADCFANFPGAIMTIKSMSISGNYYLTKEGGDFLISKDDIAGKLICCKRIIHREALPGEYVVVKEKPDFAIYDVGDIKKVKSVSKDKKYILYGSKDNQILFHGQYDVLEGYSAAHNGISIGDVVTVEKEISYSHYSDCSILGEYKGNFVDGALLKKDRCKHYRVVAIGYDSRDSLIDNKIRDLAVIQDPMTTQVFIVNTSDIERVDDK